MGCVYMATKDVYVRDRDGAVATGVFDGHGRAMRVDNVIFNISDRRGSCSTITYVTLDGTRDNTGLSVLLVPPLREGESVEAYKKEHLVECVGEMLGHAERDGFDSVVMRSDSVTRVYLGDHSYGPEYTLESVVDAKGEPVRTIDMDAVHEAVVDYSYGGVDPRPHVGEPVSVHEPELDDPFGVFGRDDAPAF